MAAQASLILKAADKASKPGAINKNDGDIIVARSAFDTRRVHAEHICFPRDLGFNSDGLRDRHGLAEIFLERWCLWRFERISDKEVRRVNLVSGVEDFFSNTPNDKGAFIHVGAFVRRKVTHPRHFIFGRSGAEVWFGGSNKRRTDHNDLDAVWSEIEARTTERAAQHEHWPWGPDELKHHLAISTNDFSQDQREELYAGEFYTYSFDDLAGRPFTVTADFKARAHHVDWRESISVPAGRVLNRDIRVEHHREATYALTTVVIDKPPVSESEIVAALQPQVDRYTQKEERVKDLGPRPRHIVDPSKIKNRFSPKNT